MAGVWLNAYCYEFTLRLRRNELHRSQSYNLILPNRHRKTQAHFWAPGSLF